MKTLLQWMKSHGLRCCRPKNGHSNGRLSHSSSRMWNCPKNNGRNYALKKRKTHAPHYGPTNTRLRFSRYCCPHNRSSGRRGHKKNVHCHTGNAKAHKRNDDNEDSIRHNNHSSPSPMKVPTTGHTKSHNSRHTNLPSPSDTGDTTKTNNSPTDDRTKDHTSPKNTKESRS